MAVFLNGADWVELTAPPDVWTPVNVLPPAGAVAAIITILADDTATSTAASARPVGCTAPDQAIAKLSGSHNAQSYRGTLDIVKIIGGQVELLLQTGIAAYVSGWLESDDVDLLDDFVNADAYLEAPLVDDVWETLDFSGIAGTARGVILRVSSYSGSSTRFAFRPTGSTEFSEAILQLNAGDYVLPLVGGKVDVKWQYAELASMYLVGFTGPRYADNRTDNIPELTALSNPSGGALQTHQIDEEAIGVPLVSISGSAGNGLMVRQPGSTLTVKRNGYGIMPYACGVINGEIESQSRYSIGLHVWGWWTASQTTTVTITGVNTGDTIVSGDLITVSGTGLDTVTALQLSDGGTNYGLTITSQSASQLQAAAIDLLDLPYPVGALNIEAVSPLNNATRAITLAYTSDYDIQTVAGAQPYLLEGLDYADGDQVGTNVSVAGSNLTLTPDSDVLYSPAVPHGTTHTRLHYDASAATWGSGTVTVNRPDAGDGPPLWRATPAPPPARKGVAYSYAIGTLLDGDRPMTLTDSGAALPDGLAYGYMPAPNETIEAIVGTPTVDSGVSGIVTRADNGDQAESPPYTLTVIGDPTISALYVSARQPTSYELRFATDQAGTAYWIATRNPLTPTPEQIAAGQDASGSAATASGSLAVLTPGGQASVVVSPLAASTVYYNFVVQEQWSNVAAVAGETLPDPAAGTGADPLVSFYARPKKQNAPDFGG